MEEEHKYQREMEKRELERRAQVGTVTLITSWSTSAGRNHNSYNKLEHRAQVGTVTLVTSWSTGHR